MRARPNMKDKHQKNSIFPSSITTLASRIIITRGAPIPNGRYFR
jgi:hypothetical protein